MQKDEDHRVEAFQSQPFRRHHQNETKITHLHNVIVLLVDLADQNGIIIFRTRLLLLLNQADRTLRQIPGGQFARLIVQLTVRLVAASDQAVQLIGTCAKIQFARQSGEPGELIAGQLIHRAGDGVRDSSGFRLSMDDNLSAHLNFCH